MKIRVVYITVTGGERTEYLASRFSTSWEEHPPGYPSKVLTVCNGGPCSRETGIWMQALGSDFYPRPNIGADIGAYIDVARREADTDALLCLGESVFFHRPMWLARMVEVWNHRGPGLYGFFSSNLINPHLNTTAFLCPPKILSTYPEIVVTRSQRYEFEHGSRPFWKRVEGLGLPVRLITWDGDYGPQEWRAPNNILWKGDQSNCLLHCIHSERFRNATDATRRLWEKNANCGL